MPTIEHTMSLRAAACVCLLAVTSFLGASSSGNVVNMSLREASENVSRCQECKMILAGVRVLYNVLPSSVNAENIFSSVCLTVVPMLGHNSTITCPHLLQQYLPDVRSVFINDILSGACEILEICPTNHFRNQGGLSSPPASSVQLAHQVQLNQARLEMNQQSSDPLTFVQISDIHMDKDYVK
ncbi:unnamed protein product, partial [Candidula unifasciata]